jgi:site-specific recombinase XerD
MRNDGLERGSATQYLSAARIALREHPDEPWKAMDGLRLTKRTKVVIRSALKKWSEFSEDTTLAETLDTRAVKKLLAQKGAKQSPQRRIITTAEVDAVLAALEQYRGDADYPWVWPCLSAMIKIGLRAGVDLTGIQRQDILDALASDSELMMIWSKRSKQRPIPIRLILDELHALLDLHDAGREWEKVADLIAPKAEPISRQTAAYAQVRVWLKRVAQESGLDPKTVQTHAFRHAAAWRLLDLTGDIFMVRDLLGHNNIATTELYLQRRRIGEIGEKLRDAFQKRPT